MTDIEQKALALVNEVRAEAGHSVLTEHNPGVSYGCCWEALCRAIERHEAFRQEVSDAVEGVVNSTYMPAPSEHKLRRFIIAKPDPLVDAIRTEWPFTFQDGAEVHANRLRAAMKARVYEWRKIEGEG